MTHFSKISLPVRENWSIMTSLNAKGTQYRFVLSISEYMYENLWRKYPALINRITIVLLHNNAMPLLARIMQEKYWIQDGLFYPLHYIHQTLDEMISVFLVLYKMLLPVGLRASVEYTDCFSAEG